MLYETFKVFSENDILNKNLSLNISNNLNQNFQIREYQKEALARFEYYFNDYKRKNMPIHLLFNMATWSWKTFVMASLILSLYEKWYRNFLFFVNSTNIIEKTKDNFLNSNSSKYLFNDKITFDQKIINIKEVTNFSSISDESINIKFTTIQWLHSDLNTIKENWVSYDDFIEQKIVILSDEAHHINATTKKWKLNKTEEEEKKSFEITVMKIFNSHLENILLEFTATIDLSNPNILEKYTDKIIYKYDLKEFRLDWYSKEVDILKADMKQEDRILQALILSQYRYYLAEENKIYCKPVILFKAQKTVAESKENLVNFNNLIKNLKLEKIENIKNLTNSQVVIKAINYFENKIWLELLTQWIKEDFAKEFCLSANDDSEAWKNQLLLNNLEHKSNKIRAIFAVQKLNEWWDVLNLFDIVRLYESRSNVIDKSWKVKVWPQTISEAQLIWRWARYFPFITQKEPSEDKYKRKFDKKDEEELKILETFFYHTFFDNLYITEIKQALREIWMIDEKEKKEFTLRLKNDFTKSNFYNNWLVFYNQRIEIDNSLNDSLEKIWLDTKTFDFKINTWKTWIVVVFSEDRQENIKINEQVKVLKINSDISKRILQKAIQRNSFYRFNILKKYLWKLWSIDEFINSNNYLWWIEINLYSSLEVLNNLSNENILTSVSALLNTLELEIKNKEVKYKWTLSFNNDSIKNLFKDKTISSSNLVNISKNNFSS